MKELRCLVFSDEEVIAAVIDRRRKLNERVPGGMVIGLTYHQSPHPGHGLEALIRMTDDIGDDQTLTADEAEVSAALVQRCMSRKVPLPVDSDKTLHLINGTATLMITMNFNRPPRMVAIAAPERPDVLDGADGARAPRRPGRAPKR